MYTLFEVAHTQLPISIKEILLYLSQLDRFLDVVVSFVHTYATTSKPSDIQKLHPPTLSDSDMAVIVNGRSNRNRKASTSHCLH
ncbi:uncharacterized protein RHIMIDRAFT_280489 [Rhizopus microsporus ATCC 52813]|uniref:Uncharacterized protein n=1 Tax=Rhizopus microsporus ATCC 52813 TaxID=1340429 RepID=A0A2G4SYJ2_RHIZD|nr:uncharacterized protein RHIMIDRAFT_280489 [Rhizopus microsporus ATCC 52813]PHZ13804.1 hypothetical protein RHIMIDRAFT_280489 [Rhizopus microsporus ATCC 52813]